MELRILGTHNYESRDTRMASYLVDGVLALDAGSLTRALTFEEQSRVRAIVLSHRHFDHTRDLVPLGLYARNAEFTVDVYGIQDTIDYLRDHLLNPRLGPDFTQVPSPERPAFRFHVVRFYEEFEVLGCSAVAVPVPHAVPAAAFQIASNDVKLFYTGDTGRGIGEQWSYVSPDVVLTEVTFGNDNEAKANEVGHLTPSLLGEVLDDFKAELGYLPIVIASHIHPPWEEAVRAELKQLSGRLGSKILIAEADQTINL